MGLFSLTLASHDLAEPLLSIDSGNRFTAYTTS
jgi:hypothetical protein